MSNMNYTINIESAEAARAFAEVVSGQKRVQQQTRATNQDMDRQGGILGGLAGGVKAYISSFAGLSAVYAAWRILNDEMESTARMQERFKQTQMTADQAERLIRRNLPGKTDEEKDFVVEETLRISKEQGIPFEKIAAGMGEALSAMGGEFQKAIPAVEAVARYVPDAVDAVGTFSGALADLSAVTGTDDPAVNLGLMAYTGSLGRVANAQDQATSIPGALVGVSAYGADAYQSAAFYAALTTASKDAQGKRSSSAAIGFAEQLREFFKENEKTIASLYPGMENADFLGRIQVLQYDEKLRAKFLENFTTEKRQKAPLEQLLTSPDSEMATVFARNLEAMKAVDTQDEARAFFQGEVDSLNKGRFAPAARFGRMLAGSTEAQQLEHPERSMFADLNTQIPVMLENAGASNFLVTLFQKIGKGHGQFGDIESAINFWTSQMEAQAKTLTTPDYTYQQAAFDGTFAYGVGNREPIPGTVTEQERKDASILRDAVADIRSALLEYKQELSRNTSALHEVSVVIGNPKFSFGQRSLSENLQFDPNGNV